MGKGLGNSVYSGAGYHRHRILVGVDGSAFSEIGVSYAVALAKTFGSAVSLVQVMQARDEQGGNAPNNVLGWELSRQEARAYLDRLAEKISKTTGLGVETRLEQGRAADRIVDLGRELGADLTVLGSRGAGGAPKSTLGSTAQKVLAIAGSSVFIAHSSSTTPPPSPTPGRILVPLDGSLRTESVLPTVSRMARSSGAEIVLAHVVQEPLPTALLSEAEDMALACKLAARLTSRAAAYLGRLREQLQQANVESARTIVARHGNACQWLLDVSLREQSDLVVLSAHGAACDSAQSFGSVTAFLLTHSIVPVLVLQDLPQHHPRPAQDHGGQMMAPPFMRESYAAEAS